MVAVLCGTLLIGLFAAPLLHMHAAEEHQHGAHDEHQHESLLHAHIPDCGDSDPGPHVADGDHGPDKAAAIYLSCHSVPPKAPSATPGLPAVIIGASNDPAQESSLNLSRVSHPRAPPYLFGPSLRGPPFA